MHSLMAWTLLLLAGFACCYAAPRIAGGSDTNVETYPSVVQVDSLVGIWWQQSFAASILTSRYLLSTAQGFTGILFSPRFRRVRVGSSYRNTGGEIFSVETVFNHQNFGTDGMDSDISIVRLSEALSYTPTIQPATIIAQSYVLPDNIAVTKIGWGDIDNETRAEVLQEVAVLTINLAECAQRYESLEGSWTVTPNMICTGALDIDGVGACNGDVGGPVYFDNIIVGVISWGEGCGNGTYPSVNTAVSSYTDWILSTAV